jgi:hypothetical protein
MTVKPASVVEEMNKAEKETDGDRKDCRSIKSDGKRNES